MIHIENRVYRINAHTGYVYTLPAEYINDNAAITALRNEDLGDNRISRHSVDEDLWEISGLPRPKSGPGPGCPTVAQYNGPEKFLSNDKEVGTSDSTGCIYPPTDNMTTRVRSRYNRYGVLFELFIRGWEHRNISGGPLSCNKIAIDVPAYTFKRNNANTVTSINSFYDESAGGSYIKETLYRGGNRLCWFYMNGRVGSKKNYNNAPWVFTPYAPIRFNYTP
jgi:hypothetical protein